MTMKFNLFGKHYNNSSNLKPNSFKRNIAFKNDFHEEDLCYDDNLYLDQDIDYDNYYDDLSFDNKKNSVDYFYDFDDYDYI